MAGTGPNYPPPPFPVCYLNLSWKERPEEILEVLKWAREHDAEAQRIAEAGQKVALEYLNKEARACYWYHLLSEFAKLLRYKPGKVEGRQYMEDYILIDEYLGTTAKEYDKGKALRRFKFTP